MSEHHFGFVYRSQKRRKSIFEKINFVNKTYFLVIRTLKRFRIPDIKQILSLFIEDEKLDWFQEYKIHFFGKLSKHACLCVYEYVCVCLSE
jgi:hypothetical protein